MRIYRGDRLPERLQREVLARYVHRWTHENARQTYAGACPACAQHRGPRSAEWHRTHTPLISDAQWLREHAFRVTSTGTLDERQTNALPHFLADAS